MVVRIDTRLFRHLLYQPLDVGAAEVAVNLPDLVDRAEKLKEFGAAAIWPGAQKIDCEERNKGDAARAKG